MEDKLITGYQWREDMTFAGAYQFHNNLDKEEIHVPPSTTLIPPPDNIDGKVAKWTGSEWVLIEHVPLVSKGVI